MPLIDDIHELAFQAADLLNNMNESISPDYRLGYCQGILDGIVKMTAPEIALSHQEEGK